MKKWIIAAVVLAIAAGSFYMLKGMKKKGRGDRSIQTVQAELGSIEEAVESTGVVQPLNRVEIKPPIAGRVEQMLVDEGDTVKSGQIVGWMSSTDRAAVLDAARAKGPKELKRWQDTYKPTPIVAPLSGMIILRNVVVGQTVDAGTVIAAMSDKLIVKANVDESDIGRVRMGMEAQITLDSYPTEPIEGSVSQILYEGVNVSNVITYPVKIAPKKVPPFFRSQMTANVRLIAAKKEDVVIVPSAAVTRISGSTKQVMVPGPDGKPAPREVEVGLESGDRVEIARGLEPGDKVLIFSRRYVPQQAAASSPLIMQPGRGQQQGTRPQGEGQGGRRRQSGGTN